MAQLMQGIWESCHLQPMTVQPMTVQPTSNHAHLYHAVGNAMLLLCYLSSINDSGTSSAGSST